MKEMKLFALSESIAENEKWIALLTYYLEHADSVEFNTLYEQNNLNQELKSLEPDLIEVGERTDKIYPSGIFRRYRLSQKVKEFVISKPYKDWKNYQFEDLSLMKGGAEILVTITHEDYVFAQMTEEERREFNEQGYEFGPLQEIENNTSQQGS